MGRKEFARDERGYVLMGDEKDIGVSWKNRTNVWKWANENDVTIQYQGSMSGIDVWRVKDEKQRVLFLLRWS